jgi:predicted dehydrogenase
MGERIRVSRRGFLKRTAAFAGLPWIVPAAARGAEGRPKPSERVAVGCIGVGDRGSYLLKSTLELPESQVVAVCDVKRDRRDAAQALVNGFYGDTGCATYNDFREIVERDDIDAFVIASTDHWHVLHALAAIQAGKDVYVEKPLGISVAQDQALREAVRRHRRIFQFGTQQRSDNEFRQACELVRNGRIGKLHTINAWCVGSQPGGPLDLAPVPETLDYDLWLGPAPAVPYTLERDSNKWWWFNSDYALGFIAGWGIHPIDIAFWGAEHLMKGPATIEGTAVYSEEGISDTAVSWNLTCRYDNGLTVNYASSPVPEEWQQRYGQVIDHGTAFEGDDGWICVDRTRIQAQPAELLTAPFGRNDIRLHHSTHHMRDFLNSVKTGADPASPIEDAVTGDAFCHACDIALRLGRPVKWNAKKERFIDDDTANRMLSRALRSPWRW